VVNSGDRNVVSRVTSVVGKGERTTSAPSALITAKTESLAGRSSL
jgi:hypothetical protein